MSSLFVPTQKNWVRGSVAAVVLLVVALVLPQLTWADHTPDHADSQFANLSSISPSAAYTALVEKYSTGELVYHAPGSRDALSSSISPSGAYAALVEKYKTGELIYHAPGRRDDRSFPASVNPAQTDAAFLAANPEAMAYWRYVSAQQEVAAAASSARWVALGAYYTDRAAAFLAANPEIRAFRYNGAQQDCSEPGLQC